MAKKPNTAPSASTPQKCNGGHRGCSLKDGDKDYKHSCEVCGAKPTVHPTDLCGPCCFGEGETVNGNW